MLELRTERLRLLPFAETDLDDLHALWTNPDVRRYLWDGQIISRQRAAELIAGSQYDFAHHGFGFWTMRLATGGDRVIGFCGYRRFEESGEPELLYGILPEYWGKGLVTEAGHAVIRDGFERCGFQRIIAATDTPNQSSVKVMQRLGMVFLRRGEFRGLDTVFFELTLEDHAAHQAMTADRT